jgi:ribosomal subunit interface protein
MDLVYKGRGVRLTPKDRSVAEHKLARLGRIQPRATRIEIEVIADRNDHHDVKRLEAALQIPRKTFRAKAEGPDVEIALDRLLERLERQVRDHHEKVVARKKRPSAGSNRLQSAASGHAEGE